MSEIQVVVLHLRGVGRLIYSTDGTASADDTAILVAYAPDLQQAIFTLYGGFRKDGKASLNVAAFKGHAVETWIGFLSKDEADASDSVWMGRVVV